MGAHALFCPPVEAMHAVTIMSMKAMATVGLQWHSHSFVFPWAVESSPVSVLGTSVTNLSEPPRALATSTIMWVRS